MLGNKLNIIGISGSLRADSTNSKLLAAAAHLSKEGIHLALTDLVGKLPLFSPDLDPEEISTVNEWSTLIRECDGIIISTPEYARGYPGALKNAFDWLVQGDGFVNKPFMFLKASERADLSHSSLKVVLETMSGIHVVEADGLVPLLGTNLSVEEIIDSPTFSSIIQKSVQAFKTRVEALTVTP